MPQSHLTDLGSGLCGVCFFIGSIQYAAKIVKGEGNCENLFSKIAEPPPIFCKDTIKPRAKTNLFVLCRGEVSKTKSKIAIRPRAKANFICVLPQRSTSKIVKAGSVCTRRSALRRRSGEHCVAVVRCARRISTPFAPHRCGTNGKVWPAAESYYFVLILKNRA